MGGKRNMSWNKYEAALLLDTHRRIKSGLAVKRMQSENYLLGFVRACQSAA